MPLLLCLKESLCLRYCLPSCAHTLDLPRWIWWWSCCRSNSRRDERTNNNLQRNVVGENVARAFDSDRLRRDCTKSIYTIRFGIAYTFSANKWLHDVYGHRKCKYANSNCKPVILITHDNFLRKQTTEQQLKNKTCKSQLIFFGIIYSSNRSPIA